MLSAVGQRATSGGHFSEECKGKGTVAFPLSLCTGIYKGNIGLCILEFLIDTEITVWGCYDFLKWLHIQDSGNYDSHSNNIYRFFFSLLEGLP